MSEPLPSTLGGLDRQRYPARSVRDELRANLIAALAAGRDLFPGLVGHEDTVVPQVVNALLARHDLILLGLRGQAKTRLCRMLTTLLDPWRPMVAGTPLREHPLAPVKAATRAVLAQAGDDTPTNGSHRATATARNWPRRMSRSPT